MKSVLFMKKWSIVLSMITLLIGCSAKDNSTKSMMQGIWVLESCSDAQEPNIILSDCQRKTFYQFGDDFVFHSLSFEEEGKCQTIVSKNSSYRVDGNQVYINDDENLSILVEGDKLTTHTTTKRSFDPVVNVYRKMK